MDIKAEEKKLYEEYISDNPLYSSLFSALY